MISLRHVGITVVELEKMQNFYCDLLGCKVLKTMEESGEVIDNFSGIKNIQVTTTKMELPNGALTVKDLDSLYEKLVAEEVYFFYPVQTSPDGNVKIAFCKDPEGNILELVEEL